MLTNSRYALVLIGVFSSLESISFATELDKATWVTGYKSGVTAGWCTDELIKECWTVSEKTCQSVAEKSLDFCIKQIEASLPATFSQPKDGTYWGSKVGSCIGSQYAKSLQKSFNMKSRRCQELDKPKSRQGSTLIR